MGRPKKDPEHGTPRCYNNGCREPECVRANTRAKNQSRVRKAARGRENPDQIPHGTQGYDEYDCRCDICRAAHAERMGGYRTERRKK